MAGLVPAIHDFSFSKFVDVRHEAGHDKLRGYFATFSLSGDIGGGTHAARADFLPLSRQEIKPRDDDHRRA